jgi:hypothetical protein
VSDILIRELGRRGNPRLSEVLQAATINVTQASTPFSMRCTGRKLMNRRNLTTMALLDFAVATLPQTGFAQTNPRIGTWKLNLAKSTYNPEALAPRSSTFNFQMEGQNLKNTVRDQRGR